MHVLLILLLNLKQAMNINFQNGALTFWNTVAVTTLGSQRVLDGSGSGQEDLNAFHLWSAAKQSCLLCLVVIRQDKITRSKATLKFKF